MASRSASKRSSQATLVENTPRGDTDGTERGSVISEAATKAMEKQLQQMVRDGFVTDLREVARSDLNNAKSIEPWSHLPCKLYQSPTVTRMVTTLLDHVVPGTPATYKQILSAVMQQKHTDGYCYLIGGQVRDMLKGKISKDIDFNYACTAKDVAAVCVDNEWTVKYKAIGPVDKPNYVLIGDEQTELYMEGFSISFNATTECFNQDFRQNMLFYDLTNDVILDKTGYGVADIRNSEFRLSCAPSKQFEEWAGADMTLGQKALRYVKFVVRARVCRERLQIDEDEAAFVVSLLKRAFAENGAALKGFWFGYVLGEFLDTQEGVRALYGWVCDSAGPVWWEEWLPFVQLKVGDPSWLSSLVLAAPHKAAVDLMKAAFSSLDNVGSGLISQGDLEQVMRKLNMDLSEEDFNTLFAAARPNGASQLRYHDFIDSLFGPSSS